MEIDFEDIDPVKIEYDIQRIDSDLQKISDLRQAKKELKKVQSILLEFSVVKASSMLEKEEMLAGKPTGGTMFPLRTAQGFRRYEWFKKFGALAFTFENVGNLTTFIDSPATPELLEQASVERLTKFSDLGQIGKIKWGLEKFLKGEQKHSAPTQAEALV